MHHSHRLVGWGIIGRCHPKTTRESFYQVDCRLEKMHRAGSHWKRSHGINNSLFFFCLCVSSFDSVVDVVCGRKIARRDVYVTLLHIQNVEKGWGSERRGGGGGGRGVNSSEKRDVRQKKADESNMRKHFVCFFFFTFQFKLQKCSVEGRI